MDVLTPGLADAVTPHARSGLGARRNSLRARQLAAMPKAVLTILLVSLISAPAAALAADVKNYTRSELDGWFAKYSQAKPDVRPGEVLGAKDLERIRPLVPPGFLEQLAFPELKLRIIAPRDHTPRRDYMECTEKYQAQVRLEPDGALANHVCGQPFADATLDPSDPLSGMKAAWNFIYRWQNYGQLILNLTLVYDRFGGGHSGRAPTLIASPPHELIAGINYHTELPADAAPFYGGGGTFERMVSAFYERVYFSHLAQLADHGGVLGTSDAKDFLWKEYLGFFSPYDMRGQAVIAYRYADSHRADDSWVYDSKLRRVRRISAEVKSDSVVGTDQTFDDLYTFSGRELLWKWKFLGWKDLLCVMDAQNDYQHFYGPNGTIPGDVWSVRRFAAIERRPTIPNHPYSSVVTFWDAQNWHPWLSLAFNREGKLWKVWVYQSKWSEDFKGWGELIHGVDTNAPLGDVVTDMQNERATIASEYGIGYPVVSAARAAALFDVSKLEEVHR